MTAHRPALPQRHHGGPDAQGARPHDFSTGANATGPCPRVLARLRDVDPAAYPDPASTRLRATLADWHGVAPERVLIAASASEFIQRLTAVVARRRPGPVAVPRPGYGDYAIAAAACGLECAEEAAEPGAAGSRATAGAVAPALRWHAWPDSPDGALRPRAATASRAAALEVLDLAYAPLRLDRATGAAATQAGGSAHAVRDGGPHGDPPEVDGAWRLYTPNKALGLCGVRGAYALAPALDDETVGWIDALRAAEPSWPLGAHGVAMLQAWCEPAVQRWLRESRETLADWRSSLVAGLVARGYAPRPGVAPYVCAAWPDDPRHGPPADAAWAAAGVALRDATSLGRPRHWRLNAAPPASQAVLWRVLDAPRANRRP